MIVDDRDRIDLFLDTTIELSDVRLRGGKGLPIHCGPRDEGSEDDSAQDVARQGHTLMYGSNDAQRCYCS